MNRIGIAMLIVLGFALLIGLAATQGGQTLEVDGAPVGRGRIADTALASGSLVYAEQIQLRSEVTGRVAQVLVREGERVTRGQLLMQLDQEAFRADVDVAEAGVQAATLEVQSRAARLADLQQQLDRQRQLKARGLIGADGYTQLESQVRIAQIAVQSAEVAVTQARAQRALAADRLRRSDFVAPIDGLVVSVDVKPGETVIAGTLNIVGSDLMGIADPRQLLAELRVDEADIARIGLDQPVAVYAAAHPEQALQGKVLEIGSSARQIGNKPGLAFRVRVALDGSELPLFPGMSCRAEIQTEQGSDSLHVPVAAVRQDAAGSYVWRVRADGALERVAVTPGIANDEDQAVTGELQPGDTVVVGPGRVASALTAGSRVRLKPAVAS